MNRVTPALPQLLRFAMMAAISLSALELAQSSSELFAVMNPSEIELGEVPMSELLTPADRDAQRAIVQAAFSTTKSTTETMSVARSIALIGLSGAAFMAFLGALRIRWPGGFARSASARLLGTSAFVIAFFRTLDGAQSLVISRRAAEAAVKVYETLPENNFPIFMLTTFNVVIQLGMTSLVVGLFLLIGHYFRSERVQGLFITLDGPEPEPDDE